MTTLNGLLQKLSAAGVDFELHGESTPVTIDKYGAYINGSSSISVQLGVRTGKWVWSWFVMYDLSNDSTDSLFFHSAYSMNTGRTRRDMEQRARARKFIETKTGLNIL